MQAAPLTDAGLTPYYAIVRSQHLLTPGSVAVVIGAGGGLGHMAVQILAATTATEITKGRGADLILDFVGVDDTLALSVASARTLGHVACEGFTCK